MSGTFSDDPTDWEFWAGEALPNEDTLLRYALEARTLSGYLKRVNAEAYADGYRGGPLVMYDTATKALRQLLADMNHALPQLDPHGVAHRDTSLTIQHVRKLLAERPA